MANNIPVELLQPGDKLYKRSTYGMGNTTLRGKKIDVFTIKGLSTFVVKGFQRSDGYVFPDREEVRIDLTNGKSIFNTRGYSHLHPRPLRSPMQSDESLAREVERYLRINAEEKAKFKARRAAAASKKKG